MSMYIVIYTLYCNYICIYNYYVYVYSIVNYQQIIIPEVSQIQYFFFSLMKSAYKFITIIAYLQSQKTYFRKKETQVKKSVQMQIIWVKCDFKMYLLEQKRREYTGIHTDRQTEFIPTQWFTSKLYGLARKQTCRSEMQSMALDA